MQTFLRIIWRKVRRTLRKVWASRGGGYYGLVAAITFVYLEAGDLAGDISALLHAWPVSLGKLISFIVGNVVDAFLNGISAAIWPIHWIGKLGVGPLLLALLGGTYVTYRLTRPAIIRLLEPDEFELEEIAVESASARLRQSRP
jgi:hypothetical protein